MGHGPPPAGAPGGHGAASEGPAVHAPVGTEPSTPGPGQDGIADRPGKTGYAPGKPIGGADLNGAMTDPGANGE